MSRIRIVVADQAEAIFYDTPSLGARPREVARISDPIAHLHDRDLATERPGRSYESVGGARHAIERENDPRQQEAVRFAKRIARRLDDARRRDEFEELVLVAGPPFLGLVRGELSRPTRERVGTGAMAAILGLDDDAVRAACAEAARGEIVEAVNFNAPSQVVIAGHKAAVERAAAAAKARGAKRAVMLPVSAPFHSSLLKPAAERLQMRMQEVSLRAPQIAVVNNVDVASVNDVEQIKDALVRQACNPVRWVEIIRTFAAQGVTHVVECGPGKMLAGLTKRIEGSLQGFAATDPDSLVQTMGALR